MPLADQIKQRIAQDHSRIRSLTALKTLKLPDSCITAGFVRNLVWDYLHGYDHSTPLNDYDVLFFDPCNINVSYERRLEGYLTQLLPLRWQVRNQKPECTWRTAIGPIFPHQTP